MRLITLSLIAALCLVAASSAPIHAEVQIQSYSERFSWKPDWSQTVLDELKKEEYREGETAMLKIDIDDDDLKSLDCPGYNGASFDEKSEFWVVFFSALTRAESAFNEKARSKSTRGHRSYGLLQLAKSTAKSQCSIEPPGSSVQNAKDNLLCGVKLMSWQLQGAPVRSGRKLRADLEGQIFGKNMFQWGPLRQNDHRGRSLLVNWFKKHLEQLKFCSPTGKSF